MLSAIHHAALRVANLDEAGQRWSHVLGLTEVERSQQRALLRCNHEDFALVLEQAETAPGIEYVAYELASGVTLVDARKRLEEHDVQVREVDIPLRGTGLRLADPDGNGMVLLERRKRSGTERWNAEALYSSVLPAFHPRKFGHVNYLTSDVKRVTQWYADVLGFRFTDWIGDEGCWMHVNRDHHVLAFLNKGYNHIHHIAFELVDWGEMRVAFDHLAQNHRNLVWGPGRHANARNLFSYFRMHEEELFIELFCDMEQLSDDHQTRYYPDDAHASNSWGILPPRSYFRFDEEAIRSELNQSEAYGHKLQ